MERRIEEKINTFINEFKNDIKKEIELLEDLDYKKKGEFLKFVFDYNNLKLEKEDFTKRKRVKSSVPQYNRCMAKRASGEQCTRRKRDNCDYCGTHDKNRPHGIINESEKNIVKKKNVEIWIEEINGIYYYVDSDNNIYKSEDILSNKEDPFIIGKFKIEDNKYILY